MLSMLVAVRAVVWWFGCYLLCVMLLPQKRSVVVMCSLCVISENDATNLLITVIGDYLLVAWLGS